MEVDTSYRVINQNSKFRIQQYLQNEHYALWEVIEFGDSYKAPQEESTSKISAKKKGRTVVITTEDMQKRRNDVKARTTLLLALPDEHQLRFSKYETAKELWEAILKTFGGNEATKKTKKNQLKQQYGNFKAEGLETLEQTFNRLQAIVSDLEFMDVEIEQDDLNQKFLTSLAPEWLMYTIVWRNRDDLDTMTNTNSGKGEVHTASALTASTQVSTASADVSAASISHDTDWSYMANEEENHALVADDEAPTEFALMAKSSSSSENEGLGYSVVPPPLLAQVYSPPKKDMSWTGLPEFADDTITDYSRPSPTDSPTVIKTNKVETARKSSVKYAEMYRNTSKSPKVRGGGKITGKGIIKTGKLEFENVYFVKDLKYNLFSVSQICNNKNSVLFTDSECIVLGKDFKLKDDTNVLLRTPRQHNMYSIDLNNIVPHKNLTCLVAKASADESMLWHRRLGHLNFKTMNKLVRNNLVKGLPSTCFENDHTYVDCLKGKQHKASCKTKTKDETSGILRNFITEIENLKDLKVKIIRCDNGGEFKNKEMNEFCTRKGVRREFGNARTPQQNRVAERRNRTLIEAARMMLADVKLPVTFWAEAVNTACYVQNRVLVIKSQNKTPYELFNSRTPSIGFLRPFRCHVMILNTLYHLGKFDAKGGEGYFVGYSMSSKAFRVFNKRTKKVEENLHVDFLENKLIEKGAGPNWLFDIDTLTNSINYVPVVVAGTSFTNISGTKDVASQAVKKDWNLYLTATSKIPPADQIETLTVESKIPTVLKNKKDERGIVIQNKARLVTQGYTQEEGINYEEVFAPVARIEAIRLFLAYVSFMGFIVYLMDVKSAFLYGTIDEEVYVMQPPGFQDPEFPDRVYKVKKAIYGLHQEPRAWYGTLSKYLLANGFQRGTIDQTLFIRKHKGEFLLVQVYVDDIIFGSSNPQLCREFEALMHDKFQMSAMGKLTFFLGLQVLQKKDSIFLSQDKYVGDILKKFGYSDVRSANTPMDKENPWRKDRPGNQLLEVLVSREKIDLMAMQKADYYGHFHKIKTTNEGTKILAAVDGKPRTISESSLRRHLKLNDAEGISSLPDIELFENLSLMGYNILSNQKFTFQKGQFFHQWKFLIHTIMQCLSPKSTGFNEFSRNIATVVGEGSGTLTEPHHTPSPQEQHSLHHVTSSPSHLTTTTVPIPQPHIDTPTETSTLRQYSRRATRIAQSKAFSPAADKPASLLRDDSQGEAFPTVTSLDAGHDRENFIKTSALPHESTPRVTSLDMAAKIKDQDLEISGLKARVKILEEKERGRTKPAQEDAPIKGGSMKIGEEVRVERSTELGSNDT
nr:retrotransposon protein, putative, unclassified [Tanacetum cinerariifolium]